MKRTIKKYHLKNNIKLYILLFILIIGLFTILMTIENNNYKKAVKRCGKDNIITKYTQQGDKYYKCINE